MKVLGISGSPRIGGNTDSLLDKALEGARSKGAKTNKIIINKLKMSGCQECSKVKDDGTCQINDDFQILSFGTTNFEIFGQYFLFNLPICHLIILNESILNKPEYMIIHTIVHEIAHYFTWDGDLELNEKVAEEQVVKWGFNKESEKVSYDRPEDESIGYNKGYEWAMKQIKKHPPVGQSPGGQQ